MTKIVYRLSAPDGETKNVKESNLENPDPHMGVLMRSGCAWARENGGIEGDFLEVLVHLPGQLNPKNQVYQLGRI